MHNRIPNFAQKSNFSMGKRQSIKRVQTKFSKEIFNKTYNLTLHYVRQKMHQKLYETLIKIILMTA